MATKIVVISGCSSGIGLATAVLLAKEKGFKVIATMRNLGKKDALEKAAGESLYKSLIIKELDVSKEDSIVNFTRNTLADEGKIDILINNAGMAQFGTFESVSMEQMQALFQTNFFGGARLTQEVLTDMKKRKSGHIIFISSILGVRPLPFSDFYVATKFAIEGLVGNLAPILRCFNINITSVQPGPVKTEVLANLARNQQQELDPFSADAVKEREDAMAPLLKIFNEKMLPEFWSSEQPVIEVAELIKSCIFLTKPPVRIQTSDTATKMAKQILVDHTGNQITDELEAYFK